MRTKNRWQKLSLLIACLCFYGACNRSATGDKERLGLHVTSVEAFMPERVRVAFKRSCESCHGVDGQGIAGIAPSLSRANRRGAVEWEKYLKESRNAHPVSQLPPVWLDDEELVAVAEYMANLTSGKKTAMPPTDR